jgi:hypothetical protein
MARRVKIMQDQQVGNRMTEPVVEMIAILLGIPPSCHGIVTTPWPAKPTLTCLYLNTHE